MTSTLRGANTGTTTTTTSGTGTTTETKRATPRRAGDSWKALLHAIPPRFLQCDELLPLAHALGDVSPAARIAYRSTLAHSLLLLNARDQILGAFGDANLP